MIGANDVNALNKLGTAYHNLGRPYDAISVYNHAITTDPKYLESYYNRGMAYGASKQYSKALEDFDYVIKLKANLSDIYVARGMVFAATGNLDNMCKDFEQACNLGDCREIEKAKAEDMCH
jgi:tetratricopeptide (TPR) repeat protein